MTNKIQADRMYDTLRADILACRLAPGSKLRINDIAAGAGVSLGAVREALSRLSAEGLVRAEAQKGYSVTALSLAELRDLTDARIEIERLCLRRSIERGDIDWETGLVAAWHRLTKTHERTVEDGRWLSDKWATAHSAFHLALVGACGSEKLLDLRRQLYEHSERYRRVSTPFDDQDRDIRGEHAAIFQAAIDRRTDEACRLLADHIRATSRIIEEAPLPPELIEPAMRTPSHQTSPSAAAGVRTEI